MRTLYIVKDDWGQELCRVYANDSEHALDIVRTNVQEYGETIIDSAVSAEDTGIQELQTSN